MDDLIKDKQKIEEILNEINNLKKYCNELANNTKGQKLENYINNLNKTIQLLNNKVEIIYQNNLKSINN